MLTGIPHGTEDALGDIHDGVGGLIVAPNGLPPAGKLADVLQEVIQGLADHAGCRADLLEQFGVIRGSLARPHTVLHGAIHQLPGFDQLLLTHRGADGGTHHLQQSTCSQER